MANKQFLEEYPLYKKFKTELKFFHGAERGFEVSRMPKPAIHMHCVICTSEQTFNMDNDYYEGSTDSFISNHIKWLRYVCSACGRAKRTFLLHFLTEKVDTSQTRLVIEKVGQFPPRDLTLNQNLSETLGEHTDFYKKGLECEATGYGIGAFAYFRRITEGVIDGLLDSIKTLIPDEEKAKYEEVLIETRKTRVTERKIELIKHLIPKTLCPNGENPLGVLHSALSEGLHAESDQDCLEYAEAIKQVLIYLLDQIIRNQNTSKDFLAGVKKILDKRSKKKEPA